MHKVLSSAGNLENVATDREGNHLLIVISENASHGYILDTFINHRFLCHNEAAVHERFLIIDRTDLVALGQLVPLIDESMIRCNHEMMRIGAAGDLPDQIHDLNNRLLAGGKYFILGICFISTGVDLVMVHVHNLLAGKDIAQIIFLQAFDVIKLHAAAVLLMCLKNSLPSSQIIAKDIICQHTEVIRHRQCAMGQ